MRSGARRGGAVMGVTHFSLSNIDHTRFMGTMQWLYFVVISVCYVAPGWLFQ